MFLNHCEKMNHMNSRGEEGGDWRGWDAMEWLKNVSPKSPFESYHSNMFLRVYLFIRLIFIYYIVPVFTCEKRQEE